VLGDDMRQRETRGRAAAGHSPDARAAISWPPLPFTTGSIAGPAGFVSPPRVVFGVVAPMVSRRRSKTTGE